MSDLAPNPWLAWAWLAEVMQHLLTRGIAQSAVAGPTSSLIETLCLGVQAKRDRLAEIEFKRLPDIGRIESRLRADRADYELPSERVVFDVGWRGALAQRFFAPIEVPSSHPIVSKA